MLVSSLSNMLNIAAITGLFACAGLGWAETNYHARANFSQDKCLVVPSGAEIADISLIVAEQKMARPRFFRLAAAYSGRSDQLKAGYFRIPAHSSVADIIEKITGSGRSDCGTQLIYRVGVTRILAELREFSLEEGEFVASARFEKGADIVPASYSAALEQPGNIEIRLVMAEGVTSWQVTEALNAIELLEGEIEELPAEGSLAPASYALRPGDNRAELIAEMQATQSAILEAAWEEREEGLPLETPEEALILASIIEKETAVPGERGQVASVFVNRLRREMLLQTDPTVIYGITQGRGTLGRGLRRSELNQITPWNTYRIRGLPPTPIANPGRASIEAALNPEETPYIFFVADGTGGHAFAETLTEHNRNVARWRQIEAERRQNSN